MPTVLPPSPPPRTRWTGGQIAVFWGAIALGMLLCLLVNSALVSSIAASEGSEAPKLQVWLSAAAMAGLVALPAFGLWKTWRKISP
jgi:hypothetical protein